uniref:transposase n=1 Tax=Candidatus Enterovibrio escicola TaxID=1927127 RepID=UPI000BE3EDB0|nr:transposase [Candidatus Enterovibrio escacola]
MDFVDLSNLQICHNLRILRHQVFKGTEKLGKGMMGWFYGFKLHLIINDQGGIISVKITTANVDDRMSVSEIADELWGCFYGDKGYTSDPLGRQFANRGVAFITGVKKYETKSDEALKPPDASETIYY